MIRRNKLHLIIWVGFNHRLCLRLLSKHLLSVGFLSSPMERDSPRVFLVLLPVSKGSEGIASARGADALLAPWVLLQVFLAADTEGKIPKGGRLWIETQNCFPSWCLSWSRAQVLCKAGLGFTWQSTLLSAPWKGMTWPEGHWGQ